MDSQRVALYAERVAESDHYMRIQLCRETSIHTGAFAYKQRYACRYNQIETDRCAEGLYGDIEGHIVKQTCNEIHRDRGR